MIKRYEKRIIRGRSIMAKFTAAEEQLLERITDTPLRNSLGQIRQAAEEIWATDAPRIVQDFTSHGIDHSERLAKNAAKLLETTDGRPLSSQESYLLLAGIYLHDIGMQCDVFKFPEIKKQAEDVGAKFDVEFTAETSSGYSKEDFEKPRHYFKNIAQISRDCTNQTKGLYSINRIYTLYEDLHRFCYQPRV